MPAACAELRRRGHAVREIAVAGARDTVRRGWVVESAETATPAPPPPLAEELAVLVREVAEPRTVTLARTVLVEVAEREGVPAPVRSAMALAVTEACANAVRHAYVDADTPGDVEVRAGKAGGVMTVEVADHGRGMVPRLEGPGLGLGLALIVQMADVVEIRGRPGMVVRMRFSLDGEDI
jgi:serine/threonine-protein kinase RsbW